MRENCGAVCTVSKARDVYHGSSLGNCVAGLGIVGRDCVCSVLRQLGLTCLGCSAARGGVSFLCCGFGVFPALRIIFFLALNHPSTVCLERRVGY